MEKALVILEKKCNELGWPFEKVKADFMLFCEFGEVEPENYEDAVIEYVEETENQGAEW